MTQSCFRRVAGFVLFLFITLDLPTFSALRFDLKPQHQR